MVVLGSFAAEKMLGQDADQAGTEGFARSLSIGIESAWVAWYIRFYRDGEREPLREWLDSLTGRDLPKRLAAVAAIEQVLASQGTDVCETEWGKNLGKGLYEFRVRHDARTIRQMFGDSDATGDDKRTTSAKILLRIFFTTDGSGSSCC